jgi:acetyl-CoA C-acetyltransferase
MREAVIVSSARTPIGRAYRGAFNNTNGATLGGHVIAEAVKRAGIEPGSVDDVAMGCALQQGTTGNNIARSSLLRAGLPNTVSGMTIDRQCSSGLMGVATAAKYIITDGAPIAIGAGIESISLVQNAQMNMARSGDDWLREHVPELNTSMIETAEVVAERYGVSRERQDEYAFNRSSALRRPSPRAGSSTRSRP